MMLRISIKKFRCYNPLASQFIVYWAVEDCIRKNKKKEKPPSLARAFISVFYYIDEENKK